jgi:hypothetical protein
MDLTRCLWSRQRDSSKDDDGVDDILKVHFVVSRSDFCLFWLWVIDLAGCLFVLF